MKTRGMFFLSIFYFVIQLSCKTKQEIKAYNINTILNARIQSAGNSAQEVKLQLCSELPFNWDNIIVLPPYSPAKFLKEENLNNFDDLEDRFPEFTLDEDKYVLLFIENNTIVRYSYVPRIPLDFVSLVDTAKLTFKIPKKMACEQLFVKRDNNKFSLFLNSNEN